MKYKVPSEKVGEFEVRGKPNYILLKQTEDVRVNRQIKKISHEHPEMDFEDVLDKAREKVKGVGNFKT